MMISLKNLGHVYFEGEQNLDYDGMNTLLILDLGLYGLELDVTTRFNLPSIFLLSKDEFISPRTFWFLYRISFQTEILRYTRDSCGECCEQNILEIQVRVLVVPQYLGRFLVVLLLDHEPRNFRI